MTPEEVYIKQSKSLLDHSINYRQNVIYLNKGNELIHELAKFLVAWELLQNDSTIVTEATFKQRSGRADVYELNTRTAYEVLNTESMKRFNAKAGYYPYGITVVGLNCEDVIKKHLCDKPWLKNLMK